MPLSDISYIGIAINLPLIYCHMFDKKAIIESKQRTMTSFRFCDSQSTRFVFLQIQYQ